jgi:hypothetical protein
MAHSMPDGGFVHRHSVVIALWDAGGDQVQAKLGVVGLHQCQCSSCTTPSSGLLLVSYQSRH